MASPEPGEFFAVVGMMRLRDRLSGRNTVDLVHFVSYARGRVVLGHGLGVDCSRVGGCLKLRHEVLRCLLNCARLRRSWAVSCFECGGKAAMSDE